MTHGPHTPEPWEARKYNDVKRWSLYGPNGAAVLLTEANVRRIVACVNACASVPTEALEALPGDTEAFVRALVRRQAAAEKQS